MAQEEDRQDEAGADEAPHIEPNKRLCESNPQELELAFRQVINISQDEPGKTGSNEQEHPDKPVSGANDYKNGFNLWADIFYGVLVAPRQTMMILSDSNRFPPDLGHLAGAVLMVFLATFLTASLKVRSAPIAVSYYLSAISIWLSLSLVLYYLSIWMRGHRLTLGNTFIATGWAYLPLLFFAPVACLKQTPCFAPAAAACALWLIALQWIAFQTSLRTSATKLALILFVVPPIFVFVYLFWIGLACFSLINTLIHQLSASGL